MKTHLSSPAQSPPAGNRAYLMIEALVYIAVVFVLLGAGYAAMYRCVDNSIALRRNAVPGRWDRRPLGVAAFYLHGAWHQFVRHRADLCAL